MRQAGLYELSNPLKQLPDCGDWPEAMARMVDVELFRSALEQALRTAAVS